MFAAMSGVASRGSCLTSSSRTRAFGAALSWDDDGSTETGAGQRWPRRGRWSTMSTNAAEEAWFADGEAYDDVTDRRCHQPVAVGLCVFV